MIIPFQVGVLFNYTYRIISFITGKGVPNRLASQNQQTGRIPLPNILTPEDATQAFEMTGGTLTIFSPFGRDPLQDRQDLARSRENEFFHQVADFSTIFYQLVNGNDGPFRDGLKLFIELTHRLIPT